MFQHQSIRPFAAVLAAAALAGCAADTKDDRIVFPSPQKATESLVTALRNDDDPALRAILGPEGEDALYSGDPVDDDKRIKAFLADYDKQHELVRADDGKYVIEVGTQKWPMPVPIVEDGDGYVFATEDGLDEMTSRRIGSNELDAVQVMLVIADAQKEYAHADPDGNSIADYAAKFLSDPGKRNGLYWPTAPGERESPLGPLIVGASNEGYERSKSGEATPYRGYYYRMLMGQGDNAKGGARDYVVNGYMIGGFGAVAWPASIDNSGVMTFLVNQDGVVYQKYLGPSTDALARKMTRFDPDSTWKKVE